MKRYSILLAYPPETFNGATQTYFEHAEAADPQSAVEAVRAMASAANSGAYKPQDFEPLLCIEGHHDNLL
jgi:hypothetical protein